MANAEMKVMCAHSELADIDLLVPNPKNPNKHPKDQIKLLAKIMAHQGWRSPIVVSRRSGFIVKGHGRLEAAKLNGWKEAPVDRQDYANEADEYADMVADNKIAELSDTDLSMVLKDVLDLGPDFDFDLLGIPDFKLPEEFEPQADEDEVPEHVEPKTKRGDIYQIGRHRLMCGDSADLQSVDLLMSGKRAALVFTDPPYNHASDDKGVAAGVSKAHANLMASEWDKNFSFLDVAGSITSVIAPDATVYVCTSHHLIGEILKWMKETAKFHCVCVWHKPNPMPSLMKRHWTWAQEFVCYATFGKHTFNFPESGHASSVWSFNKKSDGSHPTQKPVEVCEHAILHSSSDGDTVVDLFGGSGSTLIACEKTGRNCFMMELDPKYCDIIIARWEKYTGKKAELLNG